MKHRTQVLWVEDNAQFDLSHLAGPVYLDGRFELTVAESASEAVRELRVKEFQALIVDIRIPPGRDERWCDLYQREANWGTAPNLGLKLLNSIFGSSEAEIKLDFHPSWLTPEKVAVLSVESHADLEPKLHSLGISLFRQKTAMLPSTTLLELITIICSAREDC